MVPGCHDQELTHIRRRDRAVEDDEWIRAMLRRAASGVLATTHDGQPFVNTNLFVYDEAAHAIYLHGARSGRTPATIAANERVCFTVSEMGRLLPAPVALEFSVEYASVVVFGRARRIDNEVAAQQALQKLLDKYFPHLQPGRDYRPITPEELARTAVYCVQIEEWSGKQKQAAADAPGAFLYGSTPTSE